ncbi:hypothetical protein BGZ94_007321 [Podila epigama]|nr:hypothetical protein BGZ94_007321 [Podila epigama]
MVTQRTTAIRASTRTSASRIIQTTIKTTEHGEDPQIATPAIAQNTTTTTKRKRTTAQVDSVQDAALGSSASKENEADNVHSDDSKMEEGSVAKRQATSTKTSMETVIDSKSSVKVVETAAVTAPPPKLLKSGSKTPVRTDAPTNLTMPNPLVLPPTPEGCVKLVSWNVSGLNASLKKGFKTYINAENADVICIQEHKVNQPLMNLVDPKTYPFSWWGFESEKKGYAGVAIFSKVKPLAVTAGLPTHLTPAVTKGRVVTLEFSSCFLIGCYVPNAGQGLVRLPERMVWDVAMKDWLAQLKKKGKQIIWTGDLNVCHQAIDLRNPTTNTKSAGFTIEERNGFSAILDEVDLVDTFREIHGNEGVRQYSYYSYRFQCRLKGIGWRLDYFVTDKEMAKRVQESVIREECYGASDHLPIVLVVKGDL